MWGPCKWYLSCVETLRSAIWYALLSRRVLRCCLKELGQLGAARAPPHPGRTHPPFGCQARHQPRRNPHRTNPGQGFFTSNASTPERSLVLHTARSVAVTPAHKHNGKRDVERPVNTPSHARWFRSGRGVTPWRVFVWGKVQVCDLKGCAQELEVKSEGRRKRERERHRAGGGKVGRTDASNLFPHHACAAAASFLVL